MARGTSCPHQGAVEWGTGTVSSWHFSGRRGALCSGHLEVLLGIQAWRDPGGWGHLLMGKVPPGDDVRPLDDVVPRRDGEGPRRDGEGPRDAQTAQLLGVTRALGNPGDKVEDAWDCVDTLDEDGLEVGSEMGLGMAVVEGLNRRWRRYQQKTFLVSVSCFGDS